MASRKAGHTQAAAAARAGFSESTGRRVEKTPILPSQRPPRQYRTRTDPFHEVWRQEIVPLLEKGSANWTSASPIRRSAHRSTYAIEANQSRSWLALMLEAEVRSANRSGSVRNSVREA